MVNAFPKGLEIGLYSHAHSLMQPRGFSASANTNLEMINVNKKTTESATGSAFKFDSVEKSCSFACFLWAVLIKGQLTREEF